MIASALNADVDEIALPYAAKVIRELFLNSAEAGSDGHEHRAVERAVRRRGAISCANVAARWSSALSVEGAEWDEETSQWTLATRAGALVADYLVLALAV